MRVHPYLKRIKAIQPAHFVGYVRKVSSGFIEADGPLCTVGDICEIECQPTSFDQNSDKVLAEVASVEEGRTVLIPLVQSVPILPDARVSVLPRNHRAAVGDEFSGRLIDAMGQAIDGKAKIFADITMPIFGKVLMPMEREETREIIQTGIRAIDGLLPIGKGQRLGIFAASGVGKTTLMSQLANQIECDRCVLCLVGERGREVETLWSSISQDADNLDRFTCVAATSDVSAALRSRAVYQALALAEYWRDQGEHVLLMVDSVTRFAMALREIGLAAGSPPTLRAYTPNVFDALPRLVERCGGAKKGGAITAIMTILSETDDVDDPIVEVMKSLLDGHIVLSRTLAEQGHFPAIDVSKSVSRQSDKLMTEAHKKSAQEVMAMLSAYEDARVMIDSGVYKAGSNDLIDKAIATKSRVSKFLIQGEKESSGLKATIGSLSSVVEKGLVSA